MGVTAGADCPRFAQAGALLGAPRAAVCLYGCPCRGRVVCTGIDAVWPRLGYLPGYGMVRGLDGVATRPDSVSTRRGVRPAQGGCGCSFPTGRSLSGRGIDDGWAV